MNRKQLILIVLLAWVIAILITLVGIAAAASDCPSTALVQVIPGATLNVRALPGGLGQILGTVNHESGELRAVEEHGGFLRLETGGWIVNKYLSVSCWGLGTPMAVTAVPSATTTRTPQPTPTRIAQQMMYCASAPEVTQIEPGLWRVMCDYR